MIERIKFLEEVWFDHLGDNPKAIKKIELVEDRDPWIYDEQKPWRRIRKKAKRQREWLKLTIFKKNTEIEFKPGLNIIVGENGSGKTTLLKALTSPQFQKDNSIHLEASGVYRALDFETGNPRFSINPDPNSKNFINQTLSWLGTIQESHGETIKRIFNQILSECHNECIILDEPETALSLRSQFIYASLLKEVSKNNQIIAVTHCKTFIEMADNVFDMDKRKWTTGKKYISSLNLKIKKSQHETK